jgi:hypothetical protein
VALRAPFRASVGAAEKELSEEFSKLLRRENRLNNYIQRIQ